MTKDGNKGLKCNGLVNYCVKKLNDKGILHFKKINPSMLLEGAINSFAFQVNPWKHKYMVRENSCEKRLELVLCPGEEWKIETETKKPVSWTRYLDNHFLNCSASDCCGSGLVQGPNSCSS